MCGCNPKRFKNDIRLVNLVKGETLGLLQLPVFFHFSGMQCHWSGINLHESRNRKIPRDVQHLTSGLALTTVPAEKVVVTASKAADLRSVEFLS